MPNSYVRFQEHQFESTMSDTLSDFVLVDCHNRGAASNIRDTWHMDKPVSCLSVPVEVSHDDAEMLREHFNTYTKESTIDRVDEFLYISRFPELAEFAATCETPIDGLLFGFDARDVASFIERNGGGISKNP